jgi:hypothetical protein
MAKLNQIIAIEKGVKAKAFTQLTDAYQKLQKGALLSGISRNYRPKDEEGERLPSESTKVQLKCDAVIDEVRQSLVRLFDVTATKDYANCLAKADIVVDGTTLAKDVPATYLIFLEKQLIDLATFIGKLPVLDVSDTWSLDAAQDVWASEAVETTRTKKVPRNHVKAEATDKHPAQVEVYYEDIVVGTWRTIKYSGALPARSVNEMRQRVERLQEAVKYAREQANAAEAEDRKIGDVVLNYVLRGNS